MRIDTADWGDRDNGEEDEKAIIKDLLDGQTGPTPPAWLPAEWIAAAKKKVNLKEVPTENVEAVIRSHAPKPPMEIALGEVRRVVNRCGSSSRTSRSQRFRPRSITTRQSCAPLPPRGGGCPAALGVEFDDRLWGLMDSFATDGACGYVATNLKEAAGAFLQRRGERKLPLFSEWLAERSSFTGRRSPEPPSKPRRSTPRTTS